ncbi:MAG: methionyl-tRNA formyltransferase [Eubacteriaceae bacterium]|jgi:methionyl-tRNA formyltransferase|nr:methionyl-tRNA formyltransferase [Eubacteriaceae bacterium]
MKKNLRIVAFGSSEFSCPMLDALSHSDYEIVALVTQPDRPSGRKQKIRFLPAKEKALALGYPVLQPEKVKDPTFLETLRELQPDLFVVAAYGQILTEELLNLPPYGALNIHGSLLPAYRGAAPIHRALMDGCPEIGVTIMKMDTGMDTGDMLAKDCIKVEDHTTVGSAHDQLAEMGAKLLLETIEGYVKGTIQPEKQDEALATYAEKVDRDTGKINWADSTETIVNLIQGTDPYPGAYTTLDGVKMKCFGAEALAYSGSEKPGTVLQSKDALIIKTSDGALTLKEVQLAGKRRMDAPSFLLGRNIEKGMILS